MKETRRKCTLLDVVPDIEKYWDYDQNEGKLPSDFAPTASTKIYTKCPICDNPVFRSVRNTWKKDENGIGHVIHCRTCGKRKKENSLIGLFPGIKEYWVYEKNTQKPEFYTISSGKKVYLRCPKCGKERYLAICDAVAKSNDGNYYLTVCFDCFKKQSLATKRQKENNIKKAIPDIEMYWGPENKYRPDELTLFSTEKIDTFCPSCEKLLHRNAYNSFQQDNDGTFHVKKCQKCAATDSNAKCAMKRSGSVLNACPEIEEWWDFEKNTIGPQDLTYGSHSEIHFKCPVCHTELYRDIHSFVTMHSDGRLLPVACSECGYSSKGDPENNLVAECPEIVKWWDYKKNAPYKPEQFTKGSGFQAYLKCPDCGIELHTGIHSLLYTQETGAVKIRHKGLCRKFRAMRSKNNLLTNYPDVTKWWNYEKNAPNRPEDFTLYSPSSAYFKCPECGTETYRHITDAFSINSKGNPILFDCPYCAETKPIKGVNSLVDLYPELATQCISLVDPSNVLPASSSRVEWKCPDCGGTWYDLIINRVNGSGCPFCEGRRALAGFNSLEDVNPKLAKEWSPNNKHSANEVLPTSSYHALWNCPTCGGEYPARINIRKVGDNACPYCSGRKVLAGFNSLEDVNPELAKEWSLNNTYSANEVLPTSSYHALWNCPTCGGEYPARINIRKIGDNACPYCSGRKVLPGYNSFKAKHPNLMENEWATFENLVIQVDPDQILDNCTKPVWWHCNHCNQLYIMSVKQRLLKQKRGHNPCTFCNGRRIKKRYNI